MLRKKLSPINFFKKILLFLSLLGIKPYVFLTFIKYFPKYLRDRRNWKRQGGKITTSYPIVNNFNAPSSVAGGQYFHQDLLVATYIFLKNPIKHIDVGSRIDGFVAHVASFREIEVFDIRPLEDKKHPNIIFKQQDFMKLSHEFKTDSLSSLHALEHFGLGRYSDSIDVNGFEKGVNSLISILDSNGMLYISFPIGRRDEVHFNAHRVFHPLSLLKLQSVIDNLKLINFDCVDDSGDLHKSVNINSILDSFTLGLGIYSFQKK
jgi:hypothetical protein